MDELILRLEEPKDYRRVEEMTRDAFWGQNGPMCDEHLLVHLLRDADGFVPALDFVAELDGQIVGHIAFSRAKIAAPDGSEHEVLTFGPLTVLPAYQSKGIGRALVEHTLPIARQLGFRAVIIFGHPDYYPRFGFKNAIHYDITTETGDNFDAFMALPLYEGALHGIEGTFIIDPVFVLDPIEVEAFEKGFAPKEKSLTLGAKELAGYLPAPAALSLADHGIDVLCQFNRFSEREVRTWEGMDPISLGMIKDYLREKGILWGTHGGARRD